jgi:multidrug efflux pump subunit AcrA (membrane-fusion protein)
VGLKVGRRPQVLAIPTQAVVSDKSPTVLLVNANHELEERPVKLGLETPDQYEIVDGLQAGDLVVIGNHAEVKAGQRVETQLITPASLNAK